MIAARALDRPRRLVERLDGRWLVAAAGAGAVVGVAASAAPLVARGMAGASVLAVYVLIALRHRMVALGLVVSWLAFLGLIRRALIPVLGWPDFDPLLLLAPACAVVLWITARRRVQASGMSALAVVLFLIVFAQVLNPFNEDLFSAVLATLFWAVPLVWFFVGRTLARTHVEKLLHLVTVLLVPVIAHGLMQSFGIFLPFEYTWIGLSGFGDAIFLEGFRIRPFSTLVSPQEYGYVLSFGLMVVWARLLYSEGRRARLGALFFTGVIALFLQASRGIFLFFVVALIVSASARLRRRGGRMVLWSGLGLVVLAASIGAPSGAPKAVAPGTSSIGTLAQRQINGFIAPESSTLPLHRELVIEAFATSVRKPLGVGLAEGSIAEQKGRGDSSTNPENDIATVFLSLGMPGGILFVAFIWAGLARAASAHRRRPDAVTLAMLGVLVAYLTQWWSGQMYAASALLWLVLGAVSRPQGASDA